MSYEIYHYNVLQRILSGIETIPLNKLDLNKLKLVHRKTLKSIQYLPPPPPNYSIFGIVVTRWVTNTQLSILYSILQSDNNTVKGILNRAVYNDDPDSFCGRISSIFQTYKLPSFQELLRNLMLKSKWKHTAKTAVYTCRCYACWYLKTVSPFLCNLNELQVGKVHHVWNSVDSNLLEIKKKKLECLLCFTNFNSKTQNAIFVV